VSSASSAVQRLRTATPVEQWSLANAGAVLAAAVGAVWMQATWPLVVVGGGMLLLLVGVSRAQWTPDGAFGRANALTALRLAAICSLPFLPPDAPFLCAGVGLAVLLADGVDGWLARRHDLASEFGEFFDKETDALFLLLLCALAAFRQSLPGAVVVLGLLRYVFVVALFLLQPRETKEQRSNSARYIYVGMVLALLSAFFPVPAVYQPLTAVASAALCVSFARYFWFLAESRA
jgi:phosphatidylglycerophosphate synthase